MKSRIRLSDRVSKKTQKDIQLLCAETLHQQQKDHTRRMIKIFCVTLHQLFGFGAERCLKALRKIEELSIDRENDEVFWAHIDRYLEQIGLTFDKENYEEIDG